MINGIDYLHSMRIFHRDLKPANILISFNQGYPYIKIADFGLSRTIHQPFRPYSSDILTFWYRCPELLLDFKEQNYGISVDVWSLGLIFIEMIFCTGPANSGFFRAEETNTFDMLRQMHMVLGKDEPSSSLLGEENPVAKKMR
jgi:serine/threonine protein kinase